MRRASLVLAFAVLAVAIVGAGEDFTRFKAKGKYTLDALYAYPLKWGVAPSAVAWSPNSQSIAFLWNNGGGRFFDIYVAAIPDGRVTRLTDMHRLPPDPVQDDKRTEAEKVEAAHFDPGVTAFAWSPDARKIAFTYRGDVFLAAPSDPNAIGRVVKTATSESDLQFAPDGKRLAFVRAGNLWALDPAAGAEVQLTTMTPEDGVSITRYGWSPRGDQIFLQLSDISFFPKQAMPDFTLDPVLPNLTRFRGVEVPRVRVGILPGDGGVVRWLDLGTDRVNVGSLRWLSDGSRLLVNFSRPPGRQWTLAAFDAKTLKATQLLDDEVVSRYSASNVTVGPDGRILVPSYRDGWLHLYALPATGGPLTQLTRGNWELQTNINSPSFLSIPQKGNRIYFASSAVHPLEKHVFSLDLGGTEPQRLTTAQGTYTPYASPDGRYLVVDYSSVESPNDLYLIDPGVPGVMKRLTTSPLPAFTDVALVKPRYASFKNPKDGVEVFYRMLTPPGFSEKGGKWYPVVFTHMYADEAKNGWSRYKPFEAFLAAEMNYLVVSLDGRGSSGRGRAFTDGRYPPSEANKDVEDHLEAAKYLKTLSYVDPKRVGCWGKSYGGDLALMVLFQEPGVFDTSVSIQGVTSRPRRIFAPDRLKANLLIIESSIDTTVYFRENALMLQALIDAGKYAYFWLYPKEDHSLALRDESFGDAMKRVARYFEDHFGLGPESAKSAGRTKAPTVAAPGEVR